LEQLADLAQTCRRSLASVRFGTATVAMGEALTALFRRLMQHVPLKAQGDCRE
jgi:hypothetical protein